MKIRTTLLTLTLSLPFFVNAQNTPASGGMRTITIPTDYNTTQFREKLVSEAIANNTQMKILGLETDISKVNVKKSAVQYLDYFTASGNLNEFTINQSNSIGLQSQFFP